MATSAWVIDVFRTEQGEALVWGFIAGLTGRDRQEAVALVKLLEEQGNALRRPQSGILGDGLFELRGKQIRIFYIFLPGRRIVLLDGEIKKRNDIPPKTLKRMRGYRDAVLRRKGKKP
ncbi:MAG: type II toxin-antitoxin system RelE/ParE family toxin [Acidobacteriota bacterium]